MTQEYRKFTLVSGQAAPNEGSTGKCLSDGSIVWVGEKGMWIWNQLNSSIMTEAEVAEYTKLLAYYQITQPREITFAEYSDPDLLTAAKSEIKTAVDNIT